MKNKVNQAGRVTLLILVTGLFATAWQNDRAPSAVASAPAPRQTYPTEPVRETVLHRWTDPGVDRTASLSSEWTPGIAVHSFPAGLPAGNYLVVDPLGESVRVIIDGSSGRGPQPIIDDHFITQHRGQRLHWIRLPNTAAPIASDSERSDRR